MPTALYQCDICRVVFEGIGAKERAEVCEKQGGPEFTFLVGETVVAMVEIGPKGQVVAREVRNVNGVHVPFYEVAFSSGQHRWFNEDSLCR